MDSSLDRLPKSALLQIFSYVNPKVLPELRFLNKSLFSIVNTIIQTHFEFTTYWNIKAKEKDLKSIKSIQNDFINKNNLSIKHLNIPDNEELRFLNKESYFHWIYNSNFDNLISLKLNLSIYQDRDSNEAFKCFKQVLFKLEKVEFDDGVYTNLDQLLVLFNPDKLKSLSIYKSSILIINNILLFKQFNKLEELQLKLHEMEINSNELITSDTVVFPKLKKLIIKDMDEKLELDLNILGSLRHLLYFNLDMIAINQQKIDFIKRTSAIDIILNYPFYFNTKMDIETLINTFKPIASISKVMTLLMSSIKSVDSEHKIDLPVFPYIHEIIFNNCKLKIQFLFNLLKYFPNIKKVKLENSSLLKSSNLDVSIPDDLPPFLFCMVDKSLVQSDRRLLKLFDGNRLLVLD